MDTFCDNLTRRTLVARLGALTSLVGLGVGAQAFAGSAGRETIRLAARIDELAGALRGETLTVAEWRAGMDALFSRVSEQDVMAAIDFDTLAARTGFADLGVATTRIRFGDEVRRLRFIAKLFAVDRGRSIIPHGHANMVSAHLPLTGAFRLRQYDQIARDDDALTVRPSIDKRILPGDLSSIGEDEDNVHWFIAEEPAYTFDAIVLGLDPAAKHSFEIFNLDMEAAQPAGDGTLRVPKMEVAEALAKYG
ncbi:hypothetical protein [Oricola sp.]|uniref:hypothetical protein n=1 Tax=Oricola sp. TaxID=1979950 RepID=UPI003BAA7A36